MDFLSDYAQTSVQFGHKSVLFSSVKENSICKIVVYYINSFFLTCKILYRSNFAYQVEAPIHSSNVMLYSKEKEVASRVGHKILEDGTRVRYLIKTGEILDSKEQWERTEKEKKTAEATA